MRITSEKQDKFRRGLNFIVGPSRHVSVRATLNMAQKMLLVTRGQGAPLSWTMRAIYTVSNKPRGGFSLQPIDADILANSASAFRKAAVIIGKIEPDEFDRHIAQTQKNSRDPVPGVSRSDLVAWLNASADLNAFTL